MLNQVFRGLRVRCPVAGGMTETGHVVDFNDTAVGVKLLSSPHNAFTIVRAHPELKASECPNLLVLIRGLPGAGKSTEAMNIKAWAEAHNYAFTHCEADNYFITKGKYKFDPTKLGAAHKTSQQMCDEGMSIPGNNIVVVSNTMTQHKEMEPYLAMADKHAFEVRVVTVGTRMSLKDLQSRNIHGVPMSSLERMADRWESYEGEIIVS